MMPKNVNVNDWDLDYFMSVYYLANLFHGFDLQFRPKPLLQ